MSDKSRETGDKKIMIRMPEWLHSALESEARRDLRSVNAQIQTLVTEALEKRMEARSENPGAYEMAQVKASYIRRKQEERLKKSKPLDDDDLPF